MLSHFLYVDLSFEENPEIVHRIILSNNINRVSEIILSKPIFHHLNDTIRNWTFRGNAFR